MHIKLILLTFSEHVYMGYGIDLERQSKLFPCVETLETNFPFKMGYRWDDSDKIKMLLFLVSYNFSGVILIYKYAIIQQ